MDLKLDSFELFPDDIKSEVLSYLRIPEIVRLSLSNRKTKINTSSHVHHLTIDMWRPHFQFFPIQCANLRTLALGAGILQFLGHILSLASKLSGLWVFSRSQSLVDFSAFTATFQGAAPLQSLRSLELPSSIQLNDAHLAFLVSYMPQLSHISCFIQSGVNLSLFLQWRMLERLHLQIDQKSGIYDLSPLRHHNQLRILTIDGWDGPLLSEDIEQSIEQIRAISPHNVGLDLVFGVGLKTTLLGHLLSFRQFSVMIADSLIAQGCSPHHPTLSGAIQSSAALIYLLEKNRLNYDFSIDWQQLLQYAFMHGKRNFSSQIISLAPIRLEIPQLTNIDPMFLKGHKVPEFIDWLLSDDTAAQTGWTHEEIDAAFFQMLQLALDGHLKRDIAYKFVSSVSLDRQSIIHRLPAFLADQRQGRSQAKCFTIFLDRFCKSKQMKIRLANEIVSEHSKSEIFESSVPLFSLFALCGYESLIKQLIPYVDKTIFRNHFILTRTTHQESSLSENESASDSDEANPLLDDENDENSDGENDDDSPVDTILTEMIRGGCDGIFHLLNSGLCRLDELNVGFPAPLACAIWMEHPDLVSFLRAGCDIDADLILWSLREATEGSLVTLFAAIETCYHSSTPVEIFQGISLCQRLCERSNPTRLLRALRKVLNVMDLSADVIQEISNEIRVKNKKWETAMTTLVRRNISAFSVVQASVELMEMGAQVQGDILIELTRIASLVPDQESKELIRFWQLLPIDNESIRLATDGLDV